MEMNTKMGKPDMMSEKTEMMGKGKMCPDYPMEQVTKSKAIGPQSK